jgi:hypothetical protein
MGNFSGRCRLGIGLFGAVAAPARRPLRVVTMAGNDMFDSQEVVSCMGLVNFPAKIEASLSDPYPSP